MGMKKVLFKYNVEDIVYILMKVLNKIIYNVNLIKLKRNIQ